ncbi:MAG TPA: EAL domain-containing protein [Solirubrobacterales bacterium]|nr:EAL domain-containing protein [Solirubrobacterales bacterium]
MRIPTKAASGGMAAALLILIAAALAGITVAIGSLLSDAAEEDAERFGLRTAETFAAITLEERDFAGGRIRTSAFVELRNATAQAEGVDSVTVWDSSREIRFTTGLTFGKGPDLPPAEAIWSGEPTSTLDDSDGLRTFLPIRPPTGDSAADVLEVQGSVDQLDAAIGSRRGNAVLIIAALAAILYAVITPAVIRGAGALAERQGFHRKALQRELRHAMEKGELRIDYQPKARLDDGRIAGVEALTRWEHPRRGTIPPLSFLPDVEQTEIVVPLTRHILEMALRQQHEWAARGLQTEMAVNVSATALTTPGGVEGIVELADAYRTTVNGGLTIELTETAVTGGELLEPLTTLKEAGIRLSIDDFGKGQSSLARLGSLPFDELKIDREFIAALDRNGGVVMVRTMLALGHRLGMTVVAEGVEWASTAAWLQKSGCDVIQGHALSVPMEPGECERWISEEGHSRLADLLSGPEKARRPDVDAAPPEIAAPAAALD